MDQELFNGMNLAEDISEEDFQYITECWERVQNVMSKDEFIEKFNAIKEEYKDASFFKDKDLVDLVVNPFTGEEVETTTGDPEITFKKVSEFEEGVTYSIYGRIMDILDVRTFAKDDGEGRVCNAYIADETGKIKLVFWNDLINKLEGISEGDVVSITSVNCKKGYRNSLELHLTSSSEIKVLTEADEDYPDVSEYPVVGLVKKISEFEETDSANLIARVSKIGEVNVFNTEDGRERSNCNVTLVDETGEINLLLWTEYLGYLDELKVGDVVKLEKVSCKQNNLYGTNELIMAFNSNLIILNESDEDYPTAAGFPSFDEVNDNKILKIADIPFGNIDVVVGRVMSMSNPKIFTSRNGKDGKLCKVDIADDTGEITVTFWTENIKHLRHISEGDIVKFTNVDCKKGYNTDKDLSLRPRSLVKVIDEGDEYYPKDIEKYPGYDEEFVDIADIAPDQTVSVIGRLTRVPTPHTYESNGKKGKVTSLEIRDATGKISYTLWNNDVKLIESLDLKEGDIVKILNEQSRERNGELSLSHWDGRIIKVEGDYDIPEYVENIVKIGDVQENHDATLIGVITKIQDTITFKRQDGTDGYVKSIQLTDATGSIRVTLWGDDTKMELSKGDIVKVIGGNIEYDDYANGYRVNTNWNTELKINPEGNEDLAESLAGTIDSLGPIPVSDVQQHEEDGDEVDIIGRIITLNETHSFPRDDGTTGYVRSGDIADSTGRARISFWDEKADPNYISIGKAYLIENVRTRLGMTEIELNAGKTTRVIELTDAEASDLPSFEELEEQIYVTKKIDDLSEDDTSFKVVARIMEIENIREFSKQDGTTGLVRNMTIGDESGFIAVTLWEDKTNLPFDLNEAIKIQNPNIRYNDMSNRLELSVGNSTNILQPSYKELESLPDIEELQNILYTEKDIASLELEDRNVRIIGTFSEPRTERVLIPKCPFCNKTLEDEDEEECENCGNYIDKPNYLLIVSGKINDETGDISIVFYNELVEELIEMSHDDIVEQYEEAERDAEFLINKILDLEGKTLELIADVTYNNYDEEIKLRPKKILRNEY